MRYKNYFINSLLLLTTPAMVGYPNQAQASHVKSAKHHKSSHNTKKPSLQIKGGCAPTYDELMAFISAVEKTELGKCSREQLEEINLCLAQLAKAGFVSDEHCDENELDNDIQELLYGEGSPGEFALASAHANDYVFAPSDTGWETQLARFHYFGFRPNHKRCLKHGSHTSVCARILNHTSKFVEKHKTAIFIGAVVVAATVAIVLTAGGATPYVAPTAADAIASIAAAGAAGAAAASSPNERNESYPSSREPALSILPSEEFDISNALDLGLNKGLDQNFIQEDCIASVKERIAENEVIHNIRQSNACGDPGVAEVARGVVSTLVHEVYDELANFIPPPSALPKLGYNLGEDPKLSPIEERERVVAAGHQMIDQVFSTNLAVQFTPESKAGNRTVTGIIPFPGAIGGIFGDSKSLLDAGKAIDRAGFTKAGRALMKHGNREGSVFPKPAGHPANMNELGQKVLENILNHPAKQVVQGESARLGKVVDIYAPDIGGVRYSAEGQFIGFLEP